MNSLKTCPFCVKKSQIETKENWAHNKTLYAVRCTTNRCPGHPISPVWYDTKEEAIKNWNRREG